MKRDDWIALGLVAVLAYAMYLESRGTVGRVPPRRPASVGAPRDATGVDRAPLPVRLWRALRLAAAALLAACLFVVARLAALLRRARRRRGR